MSPLPSEQPVWCKTAEAAVILGRPASTLKTWRATGRGPRFHRHGASVRYLRSDLEAFVAEGMVTPGGAA